jgi:hypothetical protein
MYSELRIYLENQEIYSYSFYDDVVVLNQTFVYNKDCPAQINTWMINPESVVSYLKDSKTTFFSVSDGVDEYIKSRGFFFVSNPNQQVSLDGDLNGKVKGNADTGGSSCGVFFCDSVYSASSIDMDITGKLSLNGELKTPVSFIEEKELYKLIENNKNDFVKCYLAEISNLVDINNSHAKKLICGIDKNNVYVVAEIKSMEKLTNGCKEVIIPTYMGGRKVNEASYLPEYICGGIWGK